MEKELSYLVSNHDLERKFKSQLSQIQIKLYSELNDINDITELLPSEVCCCFILLKTTEQSGHWCCLARNNNAIYYLDSYGVQPDGELSNIAPNLKYELHENTKALTKIISTIPRGFTFEFNKMQLQEYKDNINTCGKHSEVFCKCVFLGMTLRDFQQKMKTLKATYKTTYDMIVCSLWNTL